MSPLQGACLYQLNDDFDNQCLASPLPGRKKRLRSLPPTIGKDLPRVERTNAPQGQCPHSSLRPNAAERDERVPRLDFSPGLCTYTRFSKQFLCKSESKSSPKSDSRSTFPVTGTGAPVHCIVLAESESHACHLSSPSPTPVPTMTDRSNGPSSSGISPMAPLPSLTACPSHLCHSSGHSGPHSPRCHMCLYLHSEFSVIILEGKSDHVTRIPKTCHYWLALALKI